MGRPLPQWYLDEPPDFPSSDFYMTAFWRLSTTRQLGMTTGPLPWQHVHAYAIEAGLDPAMCEVFETVMYQLDDLYAEWQETERKKREPSAGKKVLPGNRESKPKGRFRR